MRREGPPLREARPGGRHAGLSPGRGLADVASAGAVVVPVEFATALVEFGVAVVLGPKLAGAAVVDAMAVAVAVAVAVVAPTTAVVVALAVASAVASAVVPAVASAVVPAVVPTVVPTVVSAVVSSLAVASAVVLAFALASVRRRDVNVVVTVTVVAAAARGVVVVAAAARGLVVLAAEAERTPQSTTSAVSATCTEPRHMTAGRGITIINEPNSIRHPIV